MSEPVEGPARRILVWDGQTRLFHLLLIVLFAVQWWSAKTDRIDLHIATGLALLGLVLFRLVWGVIGGSTARFAGFVRGPRAIIAYLRGRTMPTAGHNPLGGWSVVAMLLLLLVQTGLGLFASDEDGFDAGPLAHLVSLETSQRLLENHETLFNILLGLIGLHIAAVLYYLLVRRQNLVTPMISGAGEGAEPLRPAGTGRFIVAAALAAAFPLWLAFG